MSFNFYCLGGINFKEAEDWVKYAEEQMRGEKSFSKSTMKIITPKWTRELTLESSVKGNEFALIFIKEPAKEKGIGTLKVKGQMFNYFPKLQRKVTLSPSLLLSSWMGSDFTNDDLLKSSQLLFDYDHKFFGGTSLKSVEKIEGVDYKKIILTRKENAKVIWPKIEIYFDQKNCLPRFQYYYDKENKLRRKLSLTEVQTFQNHLFPTKWEMQEEGQGSDKKTIIQYQDIDFNFSFNEDYFTEKNLTK